MDQHKIINNWLKFYSIGPMETVAKGDSGRDWSIFTQ